MEKITLTLGQLNSLLYEQKLLVVENLLSNTYYYNKKTTIGQAFSIDDIDKDKFKEIAMKSEEPNDIQVLKRYI
jgi:hypothetical protein